MQSSRNADLPLSDRVLLTDEVLSWPHVQADNCQGYAPAHAQELVIIDSLSQDCIEAAFRADALVVFSTTLDAAQQSARRGQFDAWGSIDGKSVLVRTRGEELISGFRTREALVPDTGELALIAVGTHWGEGPGSADPEIWPYEPKTG